MSNSSCGRGKVGACLNTSFAAASNSARHALTFPIATITLINCTAESVGSCGDITFSAQSNNSATHLLSPPALAFATASSNLDTSSMDQDSSVCTAAVAMASRAPSATAFDLAEAVANRSKTGVPNALKAMG